MQNCSKLLASTNLYIQCIIFAHTSYTVEPDYFLRKLWPIQCRVTPQFQNCQSTKILELHLLPQTSGDSSKRCESKRVLQSSRGRGVGTLSLPLLGSWCLHCQHLPPLSWQIPGEKWWRCGEGNNGELAVVPEVLRTLAEGRERERGGGMEDGYEGKKREGRRESNLHYITYSFNQSDAFLWVYCSYIIYLAEPLVDHALHVVKAHCGCWPWQRLIRAR